MHAAKPAYDKLIFELSAPGRFAYSLPESDVSDSDPAALARRCSLGRSVVGSPSGTSLSGSEKAKRPGEESSKISLS